VTEVGTKVDAGKHAIRIDGTLICADTPSVYIMIHKPRGYLSTVKDSRERPIVADLLEDISDRLFPVGRLDYDSEGLMLMTNDGEFAHNVQHPRFGIPKTYLVKLKGKLSKDALGVVRKGGHLEDGFFEPVKVTLDRINPRSTWLRVVIHEGRNRILRRYFDYLGYPVVRLIRVAIGDTELGTLQAGKYRHLTEREVSKLLRMAKRKSSKLS